MTLRPQRPADFVILSARRSGSINLQDSLSRHPEINCGGEIFNPSQLQVWNQISRLYAHGPLVRWGGLWAVFALARYGKWRFPRAMLRIARPPRCRTLFGFRLFGDQISHFGMEWFLDELYAEGTRFIHLLRRDTFDQALSLVRAQVTGIWKRGPDRVPPASEPEVDVLALADRIEAAARQLHEDKLVAARSARRYRSLLVIYEEYTADEASYDRIQAFLGVRTQVRLRHVNVKTPPVDAERYRRLRHELTRREAPLSFDLEAG